MKFEAKCLKQIEVVDSYVTVISYKGFAGIRRKCSTRSRAVEFAFQQRDSYEELGYEVELTFIN